MMVRFIDDHREVYGVESICTVVPIAPSTYFLHKARQAHPTQRSARTQQDDALKAADPARVGLELPILALMPELGNAARRPASDRR